MRKSTSKSEAGVLSQKQVGYPLRVGGEFLPQLIQVSWVLFTSERKMEQEVYVQVGAASAVIQILKRLVVMKREFSQRANLSIHQSIYVPTLT